MGSEKFCLRWNDFENNISLAFRELRDDKDFFDVTLACDDEQIQAHKVILSACSPFFRNILRRNPHQNPLLYLKGVKYTDLQSVLNFMYHGEVNVAQEELNSFLAVAEDLRVKGLTQNQSGNQNSRKESLPQINSPVVKPSPHPPDREYPAPSVKRPRPVPTMPSNNSSQHMVDDDIQEVVPVKSEPRDVPIADPVPAPQISPQQQPLYKPPQQQQQSNTLAHADDQALAYPDDNYDDYGQYADEQEYQGDMTAQQPLPTGIEGLEGYSFQDPSELLQFVQKNPSDLKFHCTLCDKFSHKNSSCTKNHVESQHFPNMFSYPCDKCEMTFTTKTTLNLHRTRKHKSVNKEFY
eukprot:GFUD01021050.1.p1 GENE.GFUD01021050.1~~GFUD01021050.1.p1  ORF type:complete len:351 (-),score=69.41 GFUD01021050.1:374-1426(-)